jgi:hypothetical protein
MNFVRGGHSHTQILEDAMTTFRSVGAVAALVTITAMPVLAQEVISDPGNCAFFYPYANCQNLGPGNPYTNGGYWQSGYAVTYPHQGWHSASSPRTLAPAARVDCSFERKLGCL